MATEYISTETGCQYLRKYKIEDGTSFLYDEGFNDGIETAISCIGNEVPAADVRPVVHGGWRPNPRNPFWLNCTVCGYAKSERMIYNFCPNCGADMREVKADG